jgi:purine-binding chemotaxis protein CheW
MNKSGEYFLLFAIGQLKVALSLDYVSRAIRAVEFKELPGAPEIVTGIINIAGEVIPILNFRKRFKLENKPLAEEDKIIIVNSASLRLGFLVDDIIGLHPVSDKELKSAGDIIPGTDQIIEGVAVINKEVVIIHNLNKFLSLNEEKQLNKALEKQSE